MLSILEATDAGSIVTTTIADLSTQVGTIIPAALGLAATVFGARFLWSKAKGLISRS